MPVQKAIYNINLQKSNPQFFTPRTGVLPFYIVGCKYMKKFVALGILCAVFFIPSLADASVTITKVVINGSETTQAQVQPGANINAEVTATLSDGSKWKATTWSISAGATTTTACVNSKNAKDGTRGGSSVFTEKFELKAPASPGVYTIKFVGDGANNCGKVEGAAYTAPATVKVGTNVRPPVIAPHSDVLVSSAVATAVTYTIPTATDDMDQNIPVSCSPASGSTFPLGDTTVTCTAQDTSGNQAIPTSFKVTVALPVSTPFVMASQTDNSFLCSPTWQNCFTGGDSSAVVNLGLGSSLGVGSLKSVTIAKDENSPFVAQPWIIEIRCYTDSSYTNNCSDWVQPKSWNGNQSNVLAEFANITTDNKFWTADFTNPTHAANADGSTPVLFNPTYYYQLAVYDNGWDIGAWGSQALNTLYYVITGLTI